MDSKQTIEEAKALFEEKIMSLSEKDKDGDTWIETRNVFKLVKPLFGLSKELQIAKACWNEEMTDRMKKEEQIKALQQQLEQKPIDAGALNKLSSTIAELYLECESAADLYNKVQHIILIKIREAQEQKPVWVRVEDKPLVTWDAKGNWTCTEEGDKPFIAAVLYEDKRQPDKKLWWIRQCCIEDEVGLCVMGDDFNDSCGWEVSDITHYIPLPPNPDEQTQKPITDEEIEALAEKYASSLNLPSQIEYEYVKQGFKAALKLK